MFAQANLEMGEHISMTSLDTELVQIKSFPCTFPFICVTHCMSDHEHASTLKCSPHPLVINVLFKLSHNVQLNELWKYATVDNSASIIVSCV